MTDDIAYDTLPIGQPGTWVVDQRRRMETELVRLREFASVFVDDLADADKDLALILLGQWDSEWRSVTEAYVQGAQDGKAEALAHYANESRLLKQMLVNHWRQTQSTGAYLIQQGQDMERSAAAMADHLAEIGVPTDANVFAVE